MQRARRRHVQGRRDQAHARRHARPGVRHRRLGRCISSASPPAAAHADSSLRDIALAPDGKIVVAGEAERRGRQGRDARRAVPARRHARPDVRHRRRVSCTSSPTRRRRPSRPTRSRSPSRRAARSCSPATRPTPPARPARCSRGWSATPRRSRPSLRSPTSPRARRRARRQRARPTATARSPPTRGTSTATARSATRSGPSRPGTFRPGRTPCRVQVTDNYGLTATASSDVQRRGRAGAIGKPPGTRHDQGTTASIVLTCDRRAIVRARAPWRCRRSPARTPTTAKALQAQAAQGGRATARSTFSIAAGGQTDGQDPPDARPPASAIEAPPQPQGVDDRHDEGRRAVRQLSPDRHPARPPRRRPSTSSSHKKHCTFGHTSRRARGRRSAPDLPAALARGARRGDGRRRAARPDRDVDRDRRRRGGRAVVPRPGRPPRVPRLARRAAARPAPRPAHDVARPRRRADRDERLLARRAGVPGRDPRRPR